MKNIHILSTDKPSRLQQYSNPGGVEYDFVSKEFFFNNGNHIYITNKDNIKEGDWCFEMYNGESKATTLNFIDEKDNKWWLRQMNMNCSANDPQCKKIILTTDQDLIKDGVQAIDDEFLEFIVKNPSCEMVEVEKEFIQTPDNLKDGFYYKIIIPKEEYKHPKIFSENGNRLFFDKEGNLTMKQDCSGVHLNHCYKGEYEDSCKYGEDNCPAKQYSKDYNEEDEKLRSEIVGKYLSIKQQTLEEFKLKEKEFYNYLSKQDSWKSIGLVIQEFIQFKIKEQDKNKYSEEEVKSIIDKLFHMYASNYR